MPNSWPSNVSTAETHTEMPDGHSGEAVRESLRELLMDERTPWESFDVTCTNEIGFDTPVSSPKTVASSAHKVAVYKEPAEVMAERSPGTKDFIVDCIFICVRCRYSNGCFMFCQR